ncbi:MAG: sodium:calcium antiporter [Alphaproteobacteria bacterium]
MEHIHEERLKPGPVTRLLSGAFNRVSQTVAPVLKTPLGAVSNVFEQSAGAFKHSPLGRIGKVKDHISTRMVTMASAVAMTGMSYMSLPRNNLTYIAAVIAGFAVMHYLSEDVLRDFHDFGEKADISPLGLGVISGLVHSGTEAAVTLTSVLNGNTDLALAGIVGHQAFHTLAILGAVAAISGVNAEKSQPGFLGLKFNTMSFLSIGTAALAVQLWSGELWPSLGVASMLGGASYLYQRVKSGTARCAHDHGQGHENHGHEEHGHKKHTRLKTALSGGRALASMALLVGTSQFVVQQGIYMAGGANLSPAQLGIIVAAGGALSEAFLAIRAAYKKQGSFAFGNIASCATFNTMLIGGALAASAGLDNLGIPVPEFLHTINVPETLNPSISPAGAFATLAFIGSPALAAALMAKNKGKLTRADGDVLLAAFATYLFASSFVPSGVPCHEHRFGNMVVTHCPDSRAQEPDPMLEGLPSLPSYDEIKAGIGDGEEETLFFDQECEDCPDNEPEALTAE